MEVYGEFGQAITVGRDTLRVRRKDDKEEHTEITQPLLSPYDDSISYLMAVVSGKIKPEGLSALDTNITVVRILSASRESARTGKTVALR
jgi:predicted dehydrogenase